MTGKKKFLITFAAALLTVLFVKNDVLAANVIESKTEGNITWTVYDDGLLDISGTGELNGNNCSYNNYKSVITRVNIGKGITSTYNSFYEFRELKSATISGTVNEIGYGSFMYCNKLEEVNIPNSVSNIEYYAFYCCSGLKSITIPNSVSSIGMDAFYMCSSLESVKIPDSVTQLGEKAFYGCTLLSQVSLPDRFNDVISSRFSGTPWGLKVLGPLNGSAGDFLYTLDKDGTLTLSGNGTLKKDYNTYLYDYSKQVKTVVIPETTSELKLQYDNSSWESLFERIEKIKNNSSTRIVIYPDTSIENEYSWCNENDTTERIVALSNGTAIRVKQKLAKHYNIVFDGNGADSGSMAPMKGEAEERVSIPKNGFEKNGYRFRYWTYNNPRTGEQSYIYDGSSLYFYYSDFMKVDFDTITLKAEWTEDTSRNPTVVPRTDSSIGLKVSSITMYEDNTVTVSLPANTKATVKSKYTKVATAKYNKKTGAITVVGKSTGTTPISVKVGKTTETFNVTVKTAPLDLSTKTVTVNYKQSVNVGTLKKKNIKVFTSDKNIATAKYNKSKGRITIEGKSRGTAYVDVMYGTISKRITVNAIATTSKLKLPKKATISKPGKSTNISINATPKKSITNETPEITVDKPEIVSCEYIAKSNKIKATGLQSGTAVVTVKVGELSQSLPVTVK